MKFNFLRSYCKINLFLNVGKKIKKIKLHNIQSLVFILNLHDEIRIRKTSKRKDTIKFSGLFASQVKIRDNSILRSLVLLRNKGFIKEDSYYDVKVNKKIPVFSGLGGGSSNSASIIKYFLKKKDLTNKNIEYFSRVLGSDIKLYFYSSQSLQKNLTTIKKIKKHQKFYFILVYPFLKCSTKQIYTKVTSYDTIRKNIKINFFSKIKLIQFLKKSHNSLEKIVIKKFPKIEKTLKEIEKLNSCQFSRITGSGSTCFGLFLSKKSADLGVKKIKKKFPKYWCVTGKTI